MKKVTHSRAPEISEKEAIRRGLLLPSRTVNGIHIPAVPAGMGIFAKWGIRMVDADGRPQAFKSPKTGKLVEEVEAPVHSFTRNFGQWQRGYMQNTDASVNINETLTDDTGATYLVRLKSNGSMTGVVSIITGLSKIKFGNSSTALSTTQTNLIGTLLGPTTEGTVTVTLVVEDSTNTIFTVVGQVTNGSGGSFSVEEMGVFGEFNSSTATTNNTTMVLRDLTGTVAVPNGSTIIGTYTFTIAV